MKNKFGFILVKPQLGENIGASARSMKNFGFSKIYLVSPKFAFPNHKTKVTSVGAFDLINSAKVYDEIDKAISEFDIIISLSARRRDINKKHITLGDLPSILKKKKNSRIGFLFGPENSGLSNIDISLSNFILQIPTSKKFKSLNLSHSVTIVCYELFKFLNKSLFNKKLRNLKISSKSKISSLVKHLVNLLETKDFFIPKEKKRSMILNVNNLIHRLEPNDKELRILASIISSLGKNNR
tara:strand:- start:2542 stop:3261 length:720 start_codon:yes stop_codon:yes gene_type:complete